MNFRVWWLSAALALIGSVITPAMADEWNKETRLEFSEPLEVPGKVLAPGTYVFKLADSPSDRKIVEIFSVDASGRETFVTTVLAISAYRVDTPDKPMIALEERPSGSPQAIHTWFYPGDNTGWEFLYPKSERLRTVANQAPIDPPAPSVVETLPDPPAETVATQPPVEFEVSEEVVSEPSEMLVVVADEKEDADGDADRMLPHTAGHSMTELAAGLIMLGLGLATVFVARRRAEA
jgi:hypothetical protein